MKIESNDAIALRAVVRHDLEIARRPSESRAALHDLRGFRHVFRHGYEVGLDRERVLAVFRRWTGQRDAVLGALDAFAEALGSAIDERPA